MTLFDVLVSVFPATALMRGLSATVMRAAIGIVATVSNRVPLVHFFAVSGTRWFQDKGLGSLIEALQLFEAAVRIAEWTKAPYLIENPVSTISIYWRKPDCTFDPCDYGGYLTPSGDAYMKRTCLWIGNGFVMPKTKRVTPVEGSRMHLLGPSANRGAMRSVTPKGFAQAVFEANL